MLCWALPGQLLCGDFYHATTFWVDSSASIGRLVTSLPDSASEGIRLDAAPLRGSKSVIKPDIFKPGGTLD